MTPMAHGKTVLMEKTRMDIQTGIYRFPHDKINAIHFTPREIDVMSCLLSMRGQTKIAALLSIAPSTIITHSRHLMRKINCNSREGVVDFIETGGVESLLRAHYLGLRQMDLLRKLIHTIGRHFPKQKTWTITLPNKTHKDLLELLQHKPLRLNITTIQSHSITLQSSSGDNKTLPNQDTFLDTLTAILKTCFPDPKVDSIIQEHTAKFDTIQAQLQKSLHPSQVNHQDKPKNSTRNPLSKNITTLIASIAAVILITYTIVLPETSPSHYLHAQIELPEDSTLLQRPHLIQAIDDTYSDPTLIETTALIGMGGVGKTTVANLYAKQQPADIVWTINAKSQQTLQDSFIHLANALARKENTEPQVKEILGIEESDIRQQKIIAFVQTILHQHPGWFLVYENVSDFDTLTPFFPKDKDLWGTGRILLTSRNQILKQNMRINHAIDVNKLTSAEKLFLFESIYFDTEKPQHKSRKLEDFLKNIPPYPLDVTLAAHYLKTTQTTFDAYLEKLFKERFENVKRNILTQSSNYASTRYSIIGITTENILHEDPTYQETLLLLSLIHTNNIPRDLLSITTTDEALDQLIIRLKEYSLISHTTTTPDTPARLTIHPSTQAVLFNYLTTHLSLSPTHPMIQSLALKIDSYLDQVRQRENHETMNTALLHATQFLKPNHPLTPEIRATLSAKIGALYYHVGDYDNAITWLHSSLELLRENNGNTAWALAYLGDSEREKGDYSKALIHLKESVQIYESYFPNNPKDVAWAMTRLGNLYRRMDNPQAAKIHMEKAISIYKTHTPEAETEIAWAQTYLANVYNRLGEYTNAKAALENAITIQKNTFGQDSVRVAWALSFLGDIHKNLHEYEHALDTLLHSLNIYESNYGKYHNENARMLQSIGEVYTHLEDFRSAEHYLLDAYEILKRADHPEMYQPLQSLGHMYSVKAMAAEKKGESTSANQLHERAEAMKTEASNIHRVHFQPKKR